jgi:WD40 repeat protein
MGGSLLGAIPSTVATQSSPLLNTVDTESQICAVVWSPHSRELVSSHGYSRYHLCVWRYDTMEKLVDLVGHTSRVLQLALSPDGETVCSVGDESLRLWKIFEKPKQDDDDFSFFRRSSGRTLVSRASDALPRSSPISKAPISYAYRSPVGLIR